MMCHKLTQMAKKLNSLYGPPLFKSEKKYIILYMFDK